MKTNFRFLTRPLALVAASLALTGAALAQTPGQPQYLYDEHGQRYSYDSRTHYPGSLHNAPEDSRVPGDRRYGRRDYAVRSLAQELHQRAAEAARQASADAYRGSRRQRRVMIAINDFARETAALRQRTDAGLASPWELRREVARLESLAASVEAEMRFARVPRQTYGDWLLTRDVLTRMNATLVADRGYRRNYR